MKKLIMVFMAVVFVAILSFPPTSEGEDSKEVLTLKLDRALQAQARIRAELQLMQYQFRERQEAITQVDQEVKTLSEKLKSLEPPKKEEPKKEAPKTKEKK